MATAPGNREQVVQMEQQWEDLKAEQTARQSLVEELFATIHRLVDENDGLRTDIKTLKFHEQNYVKEVERLTNENKALDDRQCAGPFVALLIDGDNTLVSQDSSYQELLSLTYKFLDEFVRAGVEGGHRAAKKLREAIQVYIKRLLNSQAHWKIVVRIYANFQGLLGAYTSSHTVSNPQTAEEFLIGFNRELPLFEFVNVGADKEAADNKIKENLNLYWTDEHCKHVLLAGSADTSYVNSLRPYREEGKLTTRLTLIESVPFPSKFRQLATWFPTTSFEKVFRTTKISIKEQSPQANSNRLSYAVAIASPSTSVSQNHPSLHQPLTRNVRAKKGVFKKVQLNRYGQRVDEPLQNWDDQLAKQLKQKGLCVRHFLTECNVQNCSKIHKGSVNDEERRALIRIGRDDPCSQGTHCFNRKCISAHQCIYDGRCTFGKSCRYGPEMHGINKEITVVR